MKTVVPPFTVVGLLFFLFCYPIYGQQQWADYTKSTSSIYGFIAFEGEDVWVPTQGGLVRIDRSSGSKQVYLPSNSGLKSVNVQSILVDTGGVKWIGTEQGGLLRFDGTSWQQYFAINTGDTLKNVENTYKDQQGRLWFLSMANGNCYGCSKLFYLENGQFHRVPNLPGMTMGTAFRYLAPDNDGNVWVASQTKLARFHSETEVTEYDFADIPLQTDEYITGIGFDRPRNQFYIATVHYVNSLGTYRLIRFNGLQWEVVSLPPGMTVSYSAGFQNDPQGNFLIQMRDDTPQQSKLLRFDGTSWTQYLNADLGLPGAFFENISVDAQGHFWTVSPEPGQQSVLEQEGGTWKTYDMSIFPLGTNYYEQAEFDRQGHAWLVGAGRLMEFDGLQFTPHTAAEFGIDPGIPGRLACVAIDTAAGILWTSQDGSNQASSLIKKQNTVSTIYPIPTNHDIRKIIPVAGGKIWVASDNGVGFFDGAAWVWYSGANFPLASDFILDMTLDLNGRLWAIANTFGEIARFENGQWTVVNPPPADFFRWISCDRYGYIWTNSVGGMARYDGSNWTVVPVPAGIYPQVSYKLVQDFDLSYWLTANEQVLHWDGASSWQAFDVSNSALTGSYFYDLKVDPFGNKWFVGFSGISVYNATGISNQFVNPLNSVQGTIFFDIDQDGLQATSGEPGVPNARVLTLPDSIWSFSVSKGLYTVFPSPGNHRLQYVPASDYILTSDSSEYQVQVGTANQTGYDFGCWTAHPPDSLRLDMQAGVLRCFQPNQCWVSLSNLGFADASGQLNFTYDPALNLQTASPPPTSVSGHTLSWSYELAFGDSKLIQVSFDPTGPDLLGDTLYHRVTAVPDDGGPTRSDSVAAVVFCSYDPNDKTAAPGGASLGVFSLLDDPLEYTIRFQNTGNDTAFTVVIRDTLHAAFDLNSLEIISSSHPVHLQLSSTGVATFVFENIQLVWQAKDALGSQGYVSYRIKARPGTADATTVDNTASIYFDFNPAIVTNTTANTLVEHLPLSATSPEPLKANWQLYPNPSAGTVQFDLPWAGMEVRVMDASGRLIRKIRPEEVHGQIQGLEPGFYLICPQGLTCRKLVVVK